MWGQMSNEKQLTVYLTDGIIVNFVFVGNSTNWKIGEY